jgi:hypothetical protein
MIWPSIRVQIINDGGVTWICEAHSDGFHPASMGLLLQAGFRTARKNPEGARGLNMSVP